MTRRRDPCYLLSGVSASEANVTFIEMREWWWLITKHGTSELGLFKLIELEEHFGRTITVHLTMVKLLYFSWPQYLVRRNEEGKLTSNVCSNSNNSSVLWLYGKTNSVNIQIVQNFNYRLPEGNSLRDQAYNREEKNNLSEMVGTVAKWSAHGTPRLPNIIKQINIFLNKTRLVTKSNLWAIRLLPWIKGKR